MQECYNVRLVLALSSLPDVIHDHVSDFLHAVIFDGAFKQHTSNAARGAARSQEPFATTGNFPPGVSGFCGYLIAGKP
jgi:hypothetical protein